VEALSPAAGFVLVDGNRAPKLAVPVRAVVGGDSLSVSVAAASILAKTVRDARMAELEQEFPGYGFAAHKGYGVAAHAAALARLGPCPVHRRSFRPVAALLVSAGN
jgi:ribonuclease HII